jgi:hypothetical protein
MSLFCLPKEIRLVIWSLVYFSQSPRLVKLRTKSHDENHDEQTFCPRYSPTPAPTVVNICQEARAEAEFQAHRAGHIVQLKRDPLFAASQELLPSAEEFYFRFETDILYVPLEDEHVQHFDDSPEIGFLSHFRTATGCDASLLRNIAVTQVVSSGYHDGSLTNCLRDFPNISRIIMVNPKETWESEPHKELFVRRARRIVKLYSIDRTLQSLPLLTAPRLNMEVATISRGELALVPKDMWDFTRRPRYNWLIDDG